MDKISPCLLGIGFLAGSAYTMNSKPEASVLFEKSLDDEQYAIYQEIKQERAKLYLKGLALGTVLALAYIYTTRGKFSLAINACVFAAIAMISAMLYYRLSPKSKWMADFLTTSEQVQLHTDVYKSMQYRYYSGFAMGIVGYLLLGSALSMGVVESIPFVGGPTDDFLDQFY